MEREVKKLQFFSNIMSIFGIIIYIDVDVDGALPHMVIKILMIWFNFNSSMILHLVTTFKNQTNMFIKIILKA